MDSALRIGLLPPDLGSTIKNLKCRKRINKTTPLGFEAKRALVAARASFDRDAAQVWHRSDQLLFDEQAQVLKSGRP